MTAVEAKMDPNHGSNSMDGGARFLCETFNTSDPVLAVRKSVGEIFADGRAHLPVDLDSLLAKRRIQIFFGEVPAGKEALLKPIPRGFHLILPHPAHRQATLFHDRARRFTIAHEIIESFFFSYDSETPVHWTRLPGYRALVTPAALSSSGFEERLCDYGAGLILVPTHKVGEVTEFGETIPSETLLLRAATQCSTGPLNMCHRIASYLRVKHSTHSVIALLKKCADPNSPTRHVDWRFAPTRKGGGYPVGVDIDATLKHKFFLATNKTVNGLGFRTLTAWLESGAHDPAPLGEELEMRHNGVAVQMKVKYLSFDPKRHAAVAWFELRFPAS